jgi:outer membrane lipoprotein-sorting protein
MRSNTSEEVLMTRTLIGSVLALSLIASSASALPPDTKDARAIMRAASANNGGDRTKSRMKMTIRDPSGARERTMLTRSMRVEGGRKTLILIEGPAEVRNTGFLGIDYEAGARTDEQWLYLPKLRRVARVPASGKSDAFIGSDFSYADLARQDPEDFEVRMLEASTKVGDEECWLIELTPRTPRIAEETGYAKTEVWVSKSKVVPIQFKATLTTGGKTKYWKAGDFKQVDGLWTPHRMQMRTVKGEALESETIIEVLELTNSAPDVAEDLFTQQRLERGL